MSETGFGSLSYNPLPTYNDWGFGSPTPVQLGVLDGYSSLLTQEMTTEADYQEREVGLARDTGFGSPFDPHNAALEIPGEFALVPDDGGVQLEIMGEWLNLIDDGAATGFAIFRVTIVNQETGEETFAMGDSDATTCITDFYRTRVFAGVPPLPRGTYDLHLSWNEGLNTAIITDAFTVVMRPRSQETYNIKQMVPSFFKTGPRDFTEERDGLYKQESNVGALLGSCGQILQPIVGRPTTSLRSAFTRNDTVLEVESTLGFPDEGRVFVDGYAMTYTSKTLRTLEGVEVDIHLASKIRMRERVVLDVKSAK